MLLRWGAQQIPAWPLSRAKYRPMRHRARAARAETSIRPLSARRQGAVLTVIKRIAQTERRATVSRCRRARGRRKLGSGLSAPPMRRRSARLHAERLGRCVRVERNIDDTDTSRARRDEGPAIGKPSSCWLRVSANEPFCGRSGSRSVRPGRLGCHRSHPSARF